MENDSSKIAGVCAIWGFEKGVYKVGKWGASRDQNRLYDLPAFEPYAAHWSLDPSHTRWECDDLGVGISSGDFRKVFVR